MAATHAGAGSDISEIAEAIAVIRQEMLRHFLVLTQKR